jgi:hypothetical protein
MLDRPQIESVALFFLASFLDEPLARFAAAKSVAQINYDLKEKKHPNQSLESQLVKVMFKNWKKYYKKSLSVNPIIGTGWDLPESIDITVWKQFRKDSMNEEFLAVIWSRVLHYKVTDISEGIGLTTGTIQHRISRGLRNLGEIIEQGQGQ